MFLLRLSEINGGCEKILPVSGSKREPIIVVVFSSKFFLPIFFTATNSKDRPTVDGRNSTKCGANLLAEH